MSALRGVGGALLVLVMLLVGAERLLAQSGSAQSASTRSEPAEAASAGSDSTLSGAEAVLQPGDALQVTVWRSAELSGEFMVAADGTLLHPLFREVQVTGVPLEVVEQRIRARLSSLSVNPEFVIQPLLRVSVGGEVRQPSLYRLPPGTTVAEAVALAGGATERGRLNQVRLVRDGREYRVDLMDPGSGLASESIRSGDQIYVEMRSAHFREYAAPLAAIAAAIVSLINILTR